MSNLTELVDTLEHRLGELLQKYKNLEQKHAGLLKDFNNTQVENRQLQESLKLSESKIQTLKAANALLGSNDDKKETKLRINGLIREIDQCIVQLSE